MQCVAPFRILRSLVCCVGWDSFCYFQHQNPQPCEKLQNCYLDVFVVKTILSPFCLEFAYILQEFGKHTKCLYNQKLQDTAPKTTIQLDQLFADKFEQKVQRYYPIFQQILQQQILQSLWAHGTATATLKRMKQVERRECVSLTT